MIDINTSAGILFIFAVIGVASAIGLLGVFIEYDRMAKHDRDDKRKK